MTSLNTKSNNYNIICDQLCALTSWKSDEKSCLLDTIVKWAESYEKSDPDKLEKNFKHLRELLIEPVFVEPTIPVETIIKIIQSDEIPSDTWLGRLHAEAQSKMNVCNDKDTISFDFSPVIISNADLNRQISDLVLNTQRSHIQEEHQNVFGPLDLNDISLTHDLLSFEPLSKTNTSVPSEESLNIDQTILCESLLELLQLKWSKTAIDLIRTRVTSPEIFNNKTELKTALLAIDTIITNNISMEPYIECITKTITTQPTDQWMKELNRIVDEQGKIKSVPVLLKELANNNPSLDINKLEFQYEKVINYYHTQTSQMTSANFQKQLIFENKFHTIAVIIQAAHLFKQYRPRDIQILSLLLLIESPGSGQGCLAQIRTGQGKSIIISMLAVYLSLPPMNKRVDIITTSEILAQRDADEFAPFYRMFGLSTGHNCCDSSTKPNYSVDIVYGTVAHFAGDLLRTSFYLRTEIRGDRPYDAAIVDEVDSMFIDQRQHYTQLASLTPGYKSLNILLRFIFSFFQKYNITENNEFVIRKNDGYYKVDAIEFIRQKMSDRELIRYSSYRQEYINKKLPKWIQSAKVALYELTLNVDYVINNDGRIVVVDYANTGVSQMNMHWSNGVHQFLELKHNLRMTPERMCDSFFSHVTLFKQYRRHLYGVTGTLGGEDARRFIRSVYKINTFDIPKYIDSVFEIYQSQFSQFREQWLENICNECHMIAIDCQRAVLIICETIREAEEIHLKLVSQDYHTKLYIRSDLTEHIKPEEVHPADIIVATNLAGRGTDLKTVTAVNDRGGLHVIVTFMPRNSRIEEQAFGRAGRQEKPGSARLILHNKQIGQQFEGKFDQNAIVNIWKRSIDEKESKDMADGIAEVERIEKKDRLLTRFLATVHSQKSKLSFADDIFKPGFSSLREQWALFVDTDQATVERNYSNFESYIIQQLNNSIAVLNNSSLENTEYFMNLQFEAVSRLIVHPKYLIHAGFHAFCVGNVNYRKQQALKLYRHALHIDPHDFIVHYNIVPCYIENNQCSIKKAIKNFNEAIRLLRDEIDMRKLLEIFHDPPMLADDTSTVCRQKQTIISIIEHSREESKKVDLISFYVYV